MFRRFSLRELNLQNIVFCIVAAYIVVLIIVQQGSLDNQRQKYEEAKEQLQQAEQYQSELLEQQEYVGTDEYKEEKAREAGYVEENETVFVYEFQNESDPQE